MKFYRARRNGWLKIEEVEIDRESTSSVWLAGKSNPERKLTEWDGYFATREEAKKLLIKDQQEKVDNLKARLIKAEADLFTAQNL